LSVSSNTCDRRSFQFQVLKQKKKEIVTQGFFNFINSLLFTYIKEFNNPHENWNYSKNVEMELKSKKDPGNWEYLHMFVIKQIHVEGRHLSWVILTP
jgi:hypothetical protein